MTIKALTLVAGLVLAGFAHADCYKDGKAYPTGAEVDGYVCQADGTWKKKV